MSRSCFCPSTKEEDSSLEGTTATNLESGSLLAPSMRRQHQEQNDGVPSWKEIEKMLASAMANLSAEERNVTLDDLHGIRKTDANNDAIKLEQAEKLQEMHRWMERHPNCAYQLAKADKNAQAYLFNVEFRNYFLQSTDSGTPQEAAKKMLSFFEQKLSLFGEEPLCRPITMQDLHDDDIAFLQQGFFQHLGTDSSGRQVIGMFPSQHAYANIDSLMRAMYYFMMVSFPEENCPERHSVSIYYANGMPRRNVDVKNDMQVVRRALVLTHALPKKVVASHVTLDKNHIDPSVNLAIMLSKRRSRYNFIVGSHIEVQYELRRFGIDTSPKTFPVDFSGKLSLECHQHWLQNRWGSDASARLYPRLESQQGSISQSAASPELEPGRMESSRLASFHSDLTHDDSNPAKKIASESLKFHEKSVEPGTNDVLFGRGMHTQKHAGNCKFRELLEKNFLAYENAANDMEKRILIEALYHQLKTRFGIRFLKQSAHDGTVWVIQDDRKAIYAKFSQTFRSIRAANKRLSAKAQVASHYQSFHPVG